MGKIHCDSTYIPEDRISVNIMIECKHILLEPKWLGKGNQLIENILPDSPFSSLMSHTFNAN